MTREEDPIRQATAEELAIWSSLGGRPESNRSKYHRGRADAVREYGHIWRAWAIGPDGRMANMPNYSDDPYGQGYLLGLVWAYKHDRRR